MLYKFKSRATADVIMLEANGRQLLQIWGKDVSVPHGIVTVAQIPGAIAALEAAIAAEEAPAAAKAQSSDGGDGGDDGDDTPAQGAVVQLRQRAAPLIDMLRRSAAEQSDVTW